MELHFIKRDITPKIPANSIQEKISKINAWRNHFGVSDAGVVGQAMAELLKQHPEIPGLDFFEEVFRAIDSHLYLLALPKSKLPENQMAFNFQTKQEAPFWVWICVNGKDEREKTIQAFKLNAEENLTNLRETGFLMMKN